MSGKTIYNQELDWHGLYSGSTSRDDCLFTEQSVSHPAKMSLPLLRKIIDTMQEWGWLKTGGCLVDPFAGRFSTCLLWSALHPSNRSVGVELEGHFVAMGRANVAHAERKLGRSLNLTVLRGDSRQVAALLAGDLSSTRALVARERAALEAVWQEDWRALAFQPFAGYAAAVGKGWVLEEWPDQPALIAGASVSSPPYAGSDNKDRADDARDRAVLASSSRKCPHGLGSFRGEYGKTPGQLAEMPDGPDAVVGSPPYSQSEIMHIGHSIGEAWEKNSQAAIPAERGNKRTRRYGFAEGQIGQAPDVAVASPPYGQGVIGQADPKQAARLRALTEDPNSSLAGRNPEGRWFQAMERGYGNSPENIDCCEDGAAIGSPPYGDVNPAKSSGSIDCRKNWETYKAAGGGQSFEAYVATQQRHSTHYGSAEGQIGVMPDPVAPVACGSPPYEASLASGNPSEKGGLFKDPKRASDRTLTGNYQGGPAAVSSPPYADSLNARNGIDVSKCAKAGKTSQAHSRGYAGAVATGSPPYGGKAAPGRPGNAAREAALAPADRMGASCHGDGYGEAEGQIEHLPEDAVACGSPPFEAQSGGHAAADSGTLADPALFARHAAANSGHGYAENAEEQIGTAQGESYADACLAVYRGLAAAGVRYVCLVVKNPTRKPQGIKFCKCK